MVHFAVNQPFGNGSQLALSPGMKKTMLILSVILTTGYSAAQAEEVAPSDVSTINGQLVPVGVHNEYKHSYPRLNISTNPISAAFGIYGLAVSYAVGANVAIKVDGAYINFHHIDEEGYQIDLTAPIYFRKVYTGFFLEPGVMVRNFEGDDDIGPQVLAGYSFLADSGLNVSIAAGAGRSFTNEKEVFANGYLRFGYAF